MKSAHLPPPYSLPTGLYGSAHGTSAGVAASAPGVSVLTDAERMARLQDLAQRYELSGGAVCKLRVSSQKVLANDSSIILEDMHSNDDVRWFFIFTSTF